MVKPDEYTLKTLLEWEEKENKILRADNQDLRIIGKAQEKQLNIFTIAMVLMLIIIIYLSSN